MYNHINAVATVRKKSVKADAMAVAIETDAIEVAVEANAIGVAVEADTITRSGGGAGESPVVAGRSASAGHEARLHHTGRTPGEARGWRDPERCPTPPVLIRSPGQKGNGVLAWGMGPFVRGVV